MGTHTPTPYIWTHSTVDRTTRWPHSVACATTRHYTPVLVVCFLDLLPSCTPRLPPRTFPTHTTHCTHHLLPRCTPFAFTTFYTPPPCPYMHLPHYPAPACTTHLPTDCLRTPAIARAIPDGLDDHGQACLDGRLTSRDLAYAVVGERRHSKSTTYLTPASGRHLPRGDMVSAEYRPKQRLNGPSTGGKSGRCQGRRKATAPPHHDSICLFTLPHTCCSTYWTIVYDVDTAGVTWGGNTHTPPHAFPMALICAADRHTSPSRHLWIHICVHHRCTLHHICWTHGCLAHTLPPPAMPVPPAHPHTHPCYHLPLLTPRRFRPPPTCHPALPTAVKLQTALRGRCGGSAPATTHVSTDQKCATASGLCLTSPPHHLPRLPTAAQLLLASATVHTPRTAFPSPPYCAS